MYPIMKFLFEQTLALDLDVEISLESHPGDGERRSDQGAGKALAELDSLINKPFRSKMSTSQQKRWKGKIVDTKTEKNKKKNVSRRFKAIQVNI